MNLINELRELAEDLYVGGYNRYATAMSKGADELRTLERYRTAYKECLDKTEWVQADTSLPVKYLGMHRADVLKDMISELKERLEAAEKERDALRAKVAEIEKQEPIKYECRRKPRNDVTWGLWRQCFKSSIARWGSKTSYEDEHFSYEVRALYALPGAKGEEK